jgi:hypothetical protein
MPVHFVPPEFIRVTAEYSNAVLLAILPHISDYCQKLDLPMATPVTVHQVARFDCSSEKNDPGGGVILTNGFIFGFSHGIVDTFIDRRHSFRSLEDNSRNFEFYGHLKMNKGEAVEFARAEIRRLGYSTTDAFADAEPFLLRMPIKQGTNVIPYYHLKWRDPRGLTSIDIEIDGEHKRVTVMELMCSSLWKDSLNVPVKPQELAAGEAPAFAVGNPALESDFKANVRPKMISRKEAADLLAGMLPDVSDCARKLATPIRLPITTNQVDEFNAKLHRIFLTNGYEFAYKDGYVTDFKSPDTFYVGPLKAPVQRYWGEWNMTENEAIELARATLSRLGYWKKPYFYDKKPDNVSKALKIGDHTIPRCMITWRHLVPDKSDSEQVLMDASASVEVDAGTKTVKSFHVFTSSLPKRTRAAEQR